jgi:hypothetical protein
MAFYDLQGYGGYILDRLHMGRYRNNRKVSWGVLGYDNSRALGALNKEISSNGEHCGLSEV